jgi:uridine kinase
MPRRVPLAAALELLDELAAARPGETVWVGVDGFGGAGKSTLADAIAARVPRAAVVRIDDFWGPSIPEWDWPRFRTQVLAPLLDDREARYQVWDWDADVGAEWRAVPPGTIVVVEGVSSTRSEAGVPWDLTIWVDAPREQRLRRALERDGAAMMHRWHDDWLPSEEAYAARERPQDRVDLIISGID